MKKTFLLILFLFISSVLIGQEIKGRVVDENNQPLPFVSIVEENTQNGTQTDFDGNYFLKLKNKNSNIVLFCVGFEKTIINSSNINWNLQLKSKSISINEVEISAKKNKSSETILLLDKKNSTGIESSIGSSELNKKGISNAEEGLKKVSGISFNNSRLNIRGLDDRYNQVTFNGIPIPANNADKKNIDLNILPVGVMDNMRVKKTYSSEQWSNLSGAQIDISTSDVKNTKSISLRSSFNTLTPIPNFNFNCQLGNEERKLKYFLNINLISDNQNSNGIIRLINKQGNKILDYNFKDNLSQITPSGILVLEYNLKKINFKNSTLFINQNSNLYRETFGYHFDYNNNIFTTRNTPTNHTLFTNQLSVNTNYKKWTLNSIGAISFVKSGEKAREQFVYLYDGDYQFNNIDKLDNHVFWNENIEKKTNLSLNLHHEGKFIKHQFGYNLLYSINNFDYKQKYYDLGLINSTYGSINPRNPQQYLNGNDFTELWVNNPASKTEGYTFINALFYNSTVNFTKLDLNYGTRIENVNQVVNYRDQLSPVFLKTNKIENLEFLPFISLKYKINDLSQIKFASSITTIRPRFRETVPFIYTEVFAGSKIQGNPNLIVSKIYNLDLGYEIFPKNNELFSIGCFYKFIQNPIERINVATASGRLETFQNSEASQVFGGEIELKKKIKKFILDYNLSILWSQIIISDKGNSSVVVSNFNRPLQGSSPILSNADLFYIINDNQNIGITYNLIGRKLNSVGIFGLGDIYQTKQNFLNLIYNIDKQKYHISFRINNLLNSKYEFVQNSESGEITTNFFKLGHEFSISLRYKF